MTFAQPTARPAARSAARGVLVRGVLVRGAVASILIGAMAVGSLPTLAAEATMTDVIVMGTDADAVAAATLAHGGSVEMTLAVIEGVAARVPADAVDALAADDRVTSVSVDHAVELASTSSAADLDEAVATAVEAAARADEADERAKIAKDAAKKARERAEAVATTGDVDATVAAELDAIAQAAASAEAARTAADAAAVALAAHDRAVELADTSVQAEVDALRTAKEARDHSRGDAQHAADEATKAAEEARRASAAVAVAEKKAGELAAKAEQERQQAAAERIEQARKAEERIAAEGYGMSPVDAMRLIGGSWLERNGLDGSGVDVAVIDSGVGDESHFEGRVEHALDISGTPDDRRDRLGHGSAMASIIAFKDGNDSGVADNAGIVDVKVAADGGVTDVSQVLAAIDWVVANRATGGRNIRVLSLSFGTDGTQAYEDSPLAYAVEAAWQQGIVVVVAAGNHGGAGGRLATPAIDPYVIAVGAVDLNQTAAPDDDVVPNWSGRGDGVRNPDLVAPGRSIWAFVPKDSDAARDNAAMYTGRYLPGSGTSQATAFTAGVIAALLEAYPDLTPDEVKALLVDTARALPGEDVRAAGAGVLDLHAIAELSPAAVKGRAQSHAMAKGVGTLDGDRGHFKLEKDGEVLEGDETVFGTFDGDAWRKAVLAGSTWSGSTWSGSTWSSSTWSGSTWSGSTWSASTWSASTWSASTWSASTWSASTWSMSTWSTGEHR